MSNYNREIELALNELLFAHRMVFQVLESVNRNTGQAVLLGTVIEALNEEQIRILNRTYENPLIHVVRQILTGLVKRKFVFIARSDRHRHYYASITFCTPDKMPFVFKPSHRQLVISLIKDAVNHYERPVRIGDIDRYLNEVRPDLKGDCKWFRSTIQKLVFQGVVKIAENTRRDKYGGYYYFLADSESDSINNSVPPSWLEIVFESFKSLWEVQLKKARLNNKLPEPLSTVEIKNYIIEKYGIEILPHERQAVANAVRALAKPSSVTAIRKIRRESYSKCLWVPVGIKDNEIDLYGSPKSDSERANLVVRYAVERLQRPASMNDLLEEFNLHPELKLKRHRSINTLLNTQTKFSAVKKVGWVYGKWYFYYGKEKSPEISAYLTLKKLTVEWESLNAVLELNDLDNCLLKTVAFGRYKLIENKIDEILPELYTLVINKKFGKVVNSEAKKLYEEIQSIQNQTEFWSKNNSPSAAKLPEKVKSNVIGLTIEQLWKLLQPLYPKALKVKKLVEISNLLSDDIRRIKNPHFKPSFCYGTLETVPYLFDQTDAFIYAARKWGGLECCLQAVLAGSNLGLLRDMNFVLPDLYSNDFNERLIAVACLAFLQDKTAIEYLEGVSLNDSELGVKTSAIWAFAFLGGNINELAIKIRKKEINKSVLDFLAKIELCSFTELWFI